jgi:hypothetical protein
MPRKILGFGSEQLVARLDSFKATRGLPSRTSAISMLLDYAADSKETDVATFEKVFQDSRPCFVAGPSGAGKTTTTKALVERFSGPVLVVDTSKEWTGFEPVGYERVPSLNWTDDRRYSVQLSPDAQVSCVEASLVFRCVGLAAHRGELKKWCLIVEEAHRFDTDPELRALILEARKLCAKLLLLTAEPGRFDNLAPVFRPR